MPRKIKELHKFVLKKHLTLAYKNYEKKNAEFQANKALNTTLQKTTKRQKHAQIRAKKAPHTILQKLCQEKKRHNFEPKNQLTLP